LTIHDNTDCVGTATPWGGVPILEVNGGVVLGQSMAIARYVARETGELIKVVEIDEV
jgi:glutathione S-transferase